MEAAKKLKEKIGQASNLLKEREEVFRSKADDLAISLSINSLRSHVEDLEIQLRAQEAFDRGWTAFNNGDRHTAKSEFLQAIELLPSYLGFLNNQLMVNLESAGEWQRAIIAMRFVLELKPDYEVARNNLALAYLNYGVQEADGGKLGSAADLYYIALSIASSNNIINIARSNLAATHTLLGELAYRKGNLNESLHHMLQACTFDPNADTRRNAGLAFAFLARYLFSIGDFNGAIYNFQQAEDTGLLIMELINDYGVALAMINRLDEAIIKFEQALSLDPNNKDIQENLEQARKKTPKGFHSQPPEIHYKKILPPQLPEYQMAA